MTTITLDIEVPYPGRLHPMYMGQTDDPVEAERWCTGSLLSASDTANLRKGYLLTAKHSSLGLKNEHGVFVEQILAVGRVVEAKTNKAPRIVTCARDGISDASGYVDGRAMGLYNLIGLGTGSKKDSQNWFAFWQQKIQGQALINAAIVCEVPYKPIIYAACACMKEADVAYGNRQDDVLDDVHAWMRGGPTVDASVVLPVTTFKNESQMSLFYAKHKVRKAAADGASGSILSNFDKATEAVYDLQRLRIRYKDGRRLDTATVIRDVIKLPDVVHAAIASGRMLSGK